MKTPRLFDDNITKDDRLYLFSEASKRTGFPAYIIEKDYVVSLVLSFIFNELKPNYTGVVEKPFLFKGGTSLSKAYGLIERMSEDIDLSINMDFLGFPEPEGETNSGRRKRVELIKNKNIEFLSDLLIPKLQKYLNACYEGFKIYSDETELQNIIVEYPLSMDENETSYIRPVVLIETGGRASFEPSQKCKICPLMINELKEKLNDDQDCVCQADLFPQGESPYSYNEMIEILKKIDIRINGKSYA